MNKSLLMVGILHRVVRREDNSGRMAGDEGKWCNNLISDLVNISYRFSYKVGIRV